ncbi:MAG TPA: helix-turn-helix transcriptional regulator [Longimicrobiales bacterium]
MSLKSRDWRKVLALCGELAEISEDDPAAAAHHALASVYRLIGADEGFIVFSVLALPERRETDPLRGWRPVQALYEGRAEDRRRAAAAWYHEPSRLLEDLPMRRLARRVAGAARTRTLLRRHLMSDAVWQRQPYVAEFLRSLGIRDRIQSVCPVSPRLQATLTIDRAGRGRDFGARQRALIHTVMLHLPWYFRRLARHFALLDPPTPRLSRRERETLRWLLTDRSERAIAQEMGLAVATVHQYVLSLYRKLGVNGRLELLVRHGGGVPAHPGEAIRLPPFAAAKGLRLSISGLPDRESGTAHRAPPA